MTTIPFFDKLNERCWSAWASLGVSATVPRARVVVDPEALVALTIGLGERLEPRLRDVAADWCVAEGRWLSATRLISVSQGMLGTNWIATLGPFAALVRAAGGPAWPFTTATDQRHEFRGKAELAHLVAPELLMLRSRALFGVGARADVLTSLLAGPVRPTIGDLVATTRYTKRSVLRAVTDLEMAGAALVIRGRGAGRVVLADDSPLRTWLVPGISLPDWVSFGRVALGVGDLFERASTFPQSVIGIEGRALLDREHIAVASAGLAPPDTRLLREAYTHAFIEWTSGQLLGIIEG